MLAAVLGVVGGVGVVVLARPAPAQAAGSPGPGLTLDHVNATFGPNLRTPGRFDPAAFRDLGASAVFDSSTFEPTFPGFAFDPPAGAGPRCSNRTGVTPRTRPMTAVAPNADGTCQVLPASGNAPDGTPLEAGVGPLSSLLAQFIASVNVDGAGPVTMTVRSTGAWVLSVSTRNDSAAANKVRPSYVAGPRVDLPAEGAIGPPVAGRNRTGPDTPAEVTVRFPEAGVYTLAVDYAAGPDDPLALVIDFGAAPARPVTFTDAVRSPSDLSTSVTHVATNVAVAGALGFVVAFPSELFDSTFEEHSEEITSWFRRWRDRFRRRRGTDVSGAEGRSSPASRWRSLAVFSAVVVVSALLYSLLDPGVGFDRASAVLFVGLVLALVGTTLVFSLPLVGMMRVRHRDWGRLSAVPAALPVAAGCVLLSRLANFEPGYLYGAIVGVAFVTELSLAEEGQAIAISVLWTLALSILAWVLRTPVHTAATRPGAGFLVQSADAALASVVVIGLEGAVIGLLPMRFLDGSRLKQWNRRIWMAIFGVALFAFAEILLNPSSGYVASTSRGAVFTTVAVFVGFGLGSLAFWAFFRFRFRGSGSVPNYPN